MIADGGRKPRVTDADLLAVFRSSNDPVLSTAEVADAVPIKRRGTLKRLQSLKADGRLDSKKIGGRNTVWWVPRADSQRPPDSRESVETPSQPAADQHVDGDPSADMTSSDDSDDDSTVAGDASSSDDDDLAGVEYPAGHEREKCNAAVYAARAYLAENGAATKRQIVAEVMPEHPAGYDADAALEKINAGDRYRGAWWREVVTEGLEAFDDVAKPSGGASEWKYTGDK